MEKTRITQRHLALLKEYGLSSIPSDVLRCFRYEAEEMIVQEGIPATDLKIVVTGRAKACKYAENGKSRILSYWIHGGMIGDVELVTNEEIIQNSVIAITDVECIGIPMEYCQSAFKTSICFSNHIAKELSKKLNADGKIIFSGMYGAKQRLCAYIAETANEKIFREPLTDTAVSIGVSYRHLLRMLQELCKEGILLKKPSGYHIKEEEALRTLASGILP